jgi:hypothetical protein
VIGNNTPHVLVLVCFCVLPRPPFLFDASPAISDVRARLSLKAAAWARLGGAHGSRYGQAEPRPSWRARLGSA